MLQRILKANRSRFVGQIMIEKCDISITECLPVYGTLDLFTPVISITIMEAFEHIVWLMLTPIWPLWGPPNGVPQGSISIMKSLSKISLSTLQSLVTKVTKVEHSHCNGDVHYTLKILYKLKGRINDIEPIIVIFFVLS